MSSTIKNNFQHSIVDPYFLLLDQKKVSKEKSRQTQWLRLFCHASATPCGIVVKWCCHLATYFRLTDKRLDFGLRLPAQHDKGFDLSDKSNSKRWGMFA